MEMFQTLALCLFIGLVTGESISSPKTKSDYLDFCIDGRNHKSKPGPEADLFDKCEPWTNRSCCTGEITNDLHMSTSWYNLDWNHCNTQLSPACRGHFLQDLCFYECSPNVGPWMVKVNQTFRNERAMNVPLCESECVVWYDDCKEDFTCLKNWGKDFNWDLGRNTCPEGTECKKFKEIYNSSTEFCEMVWDHSWKVVPNSAPCMLLWFSKDENNPNDRVAALKADEILSGAGSMSIFYILNAVAFLAVFGLQ